MEWLTGLDTFLSIVMRVLEIYTVYLAAHAGSKILRSHQRRRAQKKGRQEKRRRR